MRESEATLLTEIKDFEKQEDKTLQNMEETLSRISTTMRSQVRDRIDEGDIIRTTPNLPSTKRRSIVEEAVTSAPAQTTRQHQEIDFIADEQNSEDAFLDLKNIEQQLLDVNNLPMEQGPIEPKRPK